MSVSVRDSDPKRYRTEVLPLTSLTPFFPLLGQTGSLRERARVCPGLMSVSVRDSDDNLGLSLRRSDRVISLSPCFGYRLTAGVWVV